MPPIRLSFDLADPRECVRNVKALEEKVMGGGKHRKHLDALVRLCSSESDPVATQALSSTAAVLRRCMEEDPAAFARPEGGSGDEPGSELPQRYAEFRAAVAGVLEGRAAGSWTPGPRLRQEALTAFLDVLDTESRTVQLERDPALVPERSRCRSLSARRVGTGGRKSGEGGEIGGFGADADSDAAQEAGEGALFPEESFFDVLDRILCSGEVPAQTLSSLAHLARGYQDMRYFFVVACRRAFSRFLEGVSEQHSAARGAKRAAKGSGRRGSAAGGEGRGRPFSFPVGPISLLSQISATESKEDGERRASGPFYLSHLYESVTRVYLPSGASADQIGSATAAAPGPGGPAGVTVGGVTFSGSRGLAGAGQGPQEGRKREVRSAALNSGALAKFQALLEQEERLRKAKAQGEAGEADQSARILRESRRALIKDILRSGQAVEVPEASQPYSSEEAIEAALEDAVLALASAMQVLIANPQGVGMGEGEGKGKGEATRDSEGGRARRSRENPPGRAPQAAYDQAQHACLSAFLAGAGSLVLHCSRHADLLMEVLSSTCRISQEYAFQALEAILDLSASAGISYEGLYPLLFSLITPACFQSPRKAQFVSLLIRALHSKRIPAAQEAAFLKKLAQVALRAPADSVLTILLLIVSCLLRNKSLRYLIEDDYRGKASEAAGQSAGGSGEPSTSASSRVALPPQNPARSRRRSPDEVRSLCRMAYKSADLEACASRAADFDLAELRALGAHYLPSVNVVAKRLLSSEPIDQGIDLDLEDARKLDAEGVASFVFSRKLEGDTASLFAGDPQRLLRQHLAESLASTLAPEEALQRPAQSGTAAEKQARELRETYDLISRYMYSPGVDSLALEAKRRSGGIIVLEGQAQKAKVDCAYLTELSLFGRWEWGGASSGRYVAPRVAESDSESGSEPGSQSGSEGAEESDESVSGALDAATTPSGASEGDLDAESESDVVPGSSEASGSSPDDSTEDSPGELSEDQPSGSLSSPAGNSISSSLGEEKAAPQVAGKWARKEKRVIVLPSEERRHLLEAQKARKAHAQFPSSGPEKGAPARGSQPQRRIRQKK